MESEAVLPVSEAGGAFCGRLDIKGRLERNPYGVLAGALGVGFVLGGGLFTRLSAKVFGAGLRVALMVALPSFEERLTQIFAGAKLNKDKENDQ